VSLAVLKHAEQRGTERRFNQLRLNCLPVSPDQMLTVVFCFVVSKRREEKRREEKRREEKRREENPSTNMKETNEKTDYSIQKLRTRDWCTTVHASSPYPQTETISSELEIIL